MNFVKDQYKTSENLDIRINIHQKYSTNKEDWHLWLFNQYSIEPGSRILELGCGNGAFWVKNKQRVPDSWEITLSDFSEGMLADAKSSLQDMPNFHFQQINIENIPYDTDSFDVVIANHMLYHVPDPGKGIAEVRRVLKDGGLFYSSTIGTSHLKEFGMLLQEFDDSIDFASAYDHAKAFGLENGEKQLHEYFKNIDMKIFPGDLKITDLHAVLDYLRSTHTEAKEKLIGEKAEAFEQFLQDKMDEGGGHIMITKSTGLFVSK
jgi:ubiquinone/menaquinone biosynthesis C-methylase UbiE